MAAVYTVEKHEAGWVVRANGAMVLALSTREQALETIAQAKRLLEGATDDHRFEAWRSPALRRRAEGRRGAAGDKVVDLPLR